MAIHIEDTLDAREETSVCRNLVSGWVKVANSVSRRLLGYPGHIELALSTLREKRRKRLRKLLMKKTRISPCSREEVVWCCDKPVIPTLRTQCFQKTNIVHSINADARTVLASILTCNSLRICAKMLAVIRKFVTCLLVKSTTVNLHNLYRFDPVLI